MQINENGTIKVQDRDVVLLVNKRIGVVTSVRTPSVRAEFVGPVAINVTAQTDHPHIFDRLTVTPDAVVAVRDADGKFIGADGNEYMDPSSPRPFSVLFNENVEYAKKHGINIADIGTNRDPGSSTYTG